MEISNFGQVLPIISMDKNYWLIRTQGGKYYNDYRAKGIIAINWDNVSIDDINELSRDDLAHKIKMEYPEKKKPGRAAGQLNTFVNGIKKGDTVVITSYSSNKFSIGEVLEDTCFTEEIDSSLLDENTRICPFHKRRKVRWIKEVHKWDVEMSMFKLLQHAQNTISDANDYANTIESMIHDFYIRGDEAELVLRVRKEGNIPWDSFISMGKEISDLLREFNDFSNTISVNIEELDTKININSPGKFKLTGPVIAVSALGLILVAITGGGISVPLPEVLGGGNFDIQMNSLLGEVTEFLDHRQARDNQELLLNKYMDELEVKTPEELSKLIDTVEVNNSNQGDTPSE